MLAGVVATAWGSVGGMNAPLIVTRDEPLLDELLRLAAAAGVVPEVVPDVSAALRAWVGAPLVFVGVDVAERLSLAAPARRTGVHVVGLGAVPDEAFPAAVRLGAEDVVDVAQAESWVVELYGDVDETAPPGLQVGVIAGSGGAGATTFACALGHVAARDAPAVVVDLDPIGPGVDAVLGVDAAAGVRWEGLVQTVGRVGARSLREALPRRSGLGVLTFSAREPVAPPVFAVRQTLDAARRGHGVVVVDLPRQVDGVVSEVVSRCDRVVVVVRPSVVGVAAAQRLVSRLDASSPGIVVRGVGIPGADVADVLGLPLLAEVPDQRGLSEAVDLGGGPVRSPRSPLARAARSVLRGPQSRAA